MGTVDIYLLKVLQENELLSLSDIVVKFQSIDTAKPPSRTALYQRLTILEKKKNFVNCEWKEGNKFYKICSAGEKEISQVSRNLTRVYST